MKVYIGNTVANGLGKVSQIWKGLGGSLLGSGKSAAITVSEPWAIWSGSGSGNAPSLPHNGIGFDTDGIGTSVLYLYNAENDTWTATAQTLNGFIGL